MEKVVVLLVDDDPDDLFLLSNALLEKQPAIEIIEAYDGEAALVILEESTLLPDLIVLDINMPKIDGREVLKRLKFMEQFKDIPVIVYTTSANMFDQQHCDEFGAELIIKPQTQKMIDDAVSVMLHYCRQKARA